MTSNFKLQKHYFILIVAFLVTSVCIGQKATNKWKAQVALGVNNPSSSGFVEAYNAKSVNFPTVVLGIQHMFKRQYGAKLDFGFNRFASEDNVPEFKINYTRLNAQFVYDPTSSLNFLPQRMGVVAHAGPGISFVKPLGNLGENKQTFLNGMLGAEFHYGISQTMSLYLDTSYIYGFTSIDDYETLEAGLGAFNGNLFTVTLGITFSLSGCQYCD